MRDESGFAIVAAALLVALAIFFSLGTVVVVEHSRLVEKSTRAQQIQTLASRETINLSQTGESGLFFSWSFSDPDGDPQTAYQIQVGTSPGDNSMWDSGQVYSPATSAQYGGQTLQSGVTYYYRIRIFDNYEWSDWVTGNFKL